MIPASYYPRSFMAGAPGRAAVLIRFSGSSNPFLKVGGNSGGGLIEGLRSGDTRERTGLVKKAALIAAGAGAGLVLLAAALARHVGSALADAGLITSKEADAIRRWLDARNTGRRSAADPASTLAAMVEDGVITQERADAITGGSSAPCGPGRRCGGRTLPTPAAGVSYSTA